MIKLDCNTVVSHCHQHQKANVSTSLLPKPPLAKPRDHFYIKIINYIVALQSWSKFLFLFLCPSVQIHYSSRCQVLIRHSAERRHFEFINQESCSVGRRHCFEAPLRESAAPLSYELIVPVYCPESAAHWSISISFNRTESPSLIIIPFSQSLAREQDNKSQLIIFGGHRTRSL